MCRAWFVSDLSISDAHATTSRGFSFYQLTDIYYMASLVHEVADVTRGIKRAISHTIRHDDKDVSALWHRLCTCPRDVPLFDFAGQKFWVRPIEIHDGDSVKVVFEVNGTLYKAMTRLIGIDTPEIRTSNATEKALAVKARDRIATWLLPDQFTNSVQCTEKTIKETLWKTPVVVFMTCQEQDKYGRITCRIFKSDKEDDCINDVLIRENCADVYDGGKKKRSWYVD